MLPPDIENRLHDLVSAFLAENQKINLSAFRTEEMCWNGNILDSIAAIDVLAPLFPDQKTIRILDLGTGGGFPLLPLAIALPEAECVGMDAIKKKIDAVQRMVQALELKNVTLVCGRAEEWGREPAYREQFDVVTCRAVAATNVLLEYAAPFVKVGGRLLFWKSVTIDEELQQSLLARAELSCHLEKTHTYELPKDWGKRQILCFKKTFKTSGKYPRKTGIPTKTPLF